MSSLQDIKLQSGLEVTIDHKSRQKCKQCSREVLVAYIPVELTGFMEWELHECEKEKFPPDPPPKKK